MGIKTENRIIGETEYQVTQLGFAAQRATFVRLCNFAGPTITGMVKELIATASKTKTKADAVSTFTKALGDMDVSRLGDVLGDFLSTLQDKDLEYFTDAFATNTRYRPAGANGFLQLSKENRELHFSGDGFVEFFRWLVFALEVNYRGFFSEGSGLRELARGLRRAGEAEEGKSE